MKALRLFVVAFVAGLVFAGVAAAAPAVYDQVWGDRVDERLCDVEEAVGIETDECAPATTTTTTSSTTTTTTAPTTTTTAPPSGLVIPPTEPYPSRGLPAGGGFTFILSNADVPGIWWEADYWGDNGLYLDGATSLPGDREAYRCGYGFYTDGSGWDIVGRYSFVRPPDQSYGKVNDRYMDEAVRYLDGTLNPNYGVNNEIQDEDCTDVLSDIDYNNACRPVDERPRVGFFDGQGNVIDIRDYTHTNANGIVFNLHDVTDTRATIIACEDGQVGMVVYYDSLGDGQIAVDFNGTGPFG